MRPNRIEPRLPAGAYQTFEISAPLATHFRDGTCAEASCAAYEHGWRTVVDESTELGQRQAHYIRRESGRRFVETREAGLSVFTFEAGQRCFGQHKVPLDRPELYLRRGGDHRGNPSGDLTRYSGPDGWVNDFGEHQDRIARVVNG